MPNTREKLIEFVHDARMNALWHNAPNQSEYMTDMLIANGVTIPVRCGECKHYRDHPNGLCYAWTEPCTNERGYKGEVHCVEPDDFCSHGERKNEQC